MATMTRKTMKKKARTTKKRAARAGTARRKATSRAKPKRTAKRAATKKKTRTTTVRKRTSKKASAKKSRSKVARKKTARKAPAKSRSTASASTSTGKMVYYFGKTRTQGKASMKVLLGGKGANLAEMTSIGLPVPPGFTITTESCKAYNDKGGAMPKGLMAQVMRNIKALEAELKKEFGSAANPLLVSVRSGAAVSMPGMMDTILNLGLTDDVTAGLARTTKNKRFAYDAYRRLINMFGNVVMGVDHEQFEHAFDELKARLGVRLDTEVNASGLEELCGLYKEVYEREVGSVFPQDPMLQLELAIEAVFKSWNADRAISYRRISGITGLHGTGVNVQAMVYGNMGKDSGTGVAFTRNPSTGENIFYGEFLINAQGEDVVAGIRTPKPVAQMPRWNKKVHTQLLTIKNKLEKHYRDMQDIEFTIERGKLYMLQTRTGQRTGQAAVKIACDMVRQKRITEKEALLRIPAGDLTQLLLPSFDPTAKKLADILTKGLPASPGAAVGKPAFTADEAVKRMQAGESVILVRKETSPEDVDGMHSAAGILTSTGGMTSHAAVVARGWGKCCVAGAGELQINASAGTFTVSSKSFGRDDVISIDGSTGEVISGSVARIEPELSGDFAKVMRWADKYRRLGVRTNADSPEDAQRAREFGATGIGLCRTEHMFFEGERIKSMREMILADSTEARVEALSALLPYQRTDFIGIFTAMEGFPVTIRLLDPPLHEFLPHDAASQRDLAKRLGVPFERVEARVSQLHESNPMLGHRGCRLSITYPEILEMQVRAIVEAAIECRWKNIKAMPEIMHPLIGTRQELTILREGTERVIKAVKTEQQWKGKLDIPIGTMIEIPRAALTADEVAKEADFFSFGTNDLTQLTYGYSRDDAGTFLPHYVEQEILPIDPFQSLDEDGVGQLVTMAIKKGRSKKKSLKIGICGEHGGDPSSVFFCHSAGMNYVSCSPFRVPIARLAAAQASLKR